jgi:hypothetical protein
MNRTELYLGASKLETKDGEKVAITLTANSFEKPETLQSSFTNTFDVPWTRANLDAIGAIMAGERTRKQYVPGDALLKVAGLYDVWGRLAILRGDQDRASCAFISGVASLFDDLGDSSLHCLFTNLTFANDRAGFITELINVYTDGFTTAVANFSGLATTATTIDIGRMFPFPFFWKVLQDCVNFAGWTCSTDGLLQDAFFRTVAFAHNGDPYNEDLYFSYLGASWSLTAGAAPGNYVTAAPSSTTALVFNSRFTTIPPAPGSTSFQYNSTQDCGGRVYELYIDSIAVTTDAGSYDFDIRIAAFDGFTYISTLATYSSGLVTGAGASVTLPSLTLLTAWNEEQYTIHAQMKVNVGLNVVWQDFTFRFCDGRDGNRDLIWGADNIMPYAALPEMKMSDFIKDVCKMFGAIPKTDPFLKTVEFVKFEDIAGAYTDAQIWSGKLAGGEGIEFEFSYGGYAKNNLLSYDNDSELPPGYGQGVLSIDNTAVKESYNWLKLQFSASLNVALADSRVQCLGVPLFDGAEKDKVKPRVCYMVSQTDSPGFMSISDTGGSTAITAYNIARFFLFDGEQSLHGTSLIDEFHNAFGIMLGDMQKVTAYFALNGSDIAGIDFFKPVYIDEVYRGVRIHGYFILQEVKEWDGGSIVEVELLNLNQ